MNRNLGMNIVPGMLLAIALVAAACGREPSVASKSAAAYREAQAKGKPVGGGHDHGGHAATGTQPAAATVYTCPMHPEVTSAKPGTCPKCGMTLVQQAAAQRGQPAAHEGHGK